MEILFFDKPEENNGCGAVASSPEGPVVLSVGDEVTLRSPAGRLLGRYDYAEIVGFSGIPDGDDVIRVKLPNRVIIDIALDMIIDLSGAGYVTKTMTIDNTSGERYMRCWLADEERQEEVGDGS